MTSNVQDHVVDEVEVIDNGTTDRNPTERHMFHTIGRFGNGLETSGRRQHIAAIVISLMICTAIYGVLYLAMH